MDAGSYECFFLPDVKADEVGPGEYVVSTEHHTDVCDKDVLCVGDAKRRGKKTTFNMKLFVEIPPQPTLT